jgi:hypothetical protein
MGIQKEGCSGYSIRRFSRTIGNDWSLNREAEHLNMCEGARAFEWTRCWHSGYQKVLSTLENCTHATITYLFSGKGLPWLLSRFHPVR